MLHIGDCNNIIPTLDDNSIDAVITSPPYAMQRQEQYGGIPEAEYPQWTVNWMSHLIPKLTSRACVAIIIRPNIHKGQIADYMLRTRLLLRDNGWIENEEFIWIKPSSPALGSILRPRRSWESIHIFSRVEQPYMNLTAHNIVSDGVGMEAVKGVGSIIKGTKKREAGIARCRDYVSIGCNHNDVNRDNNHPAVFPPKLARWLIELLCPIDGTVLDPFIGSGSTAVAAQACLRQWIGIEQNPMYEKYMRERLAEKSSELLEF